MTVNEVFKFMWVMLILPAVVAALLPTVKATAANVVIWLRNRAKGKPTWVPGTEFSFVAFPNGVVVEECIIERVDFGFVYLGHTEVGHAKMLIPVKKIDMLKLICPMKC